MVSTYLDPNYLSSCLLIGFCLNLFLINYYKKQNCIKYRLFIYFFVYLLSILLTNSRSGILGLSIILIIYFYSSISYKRMNFFNTFLFFIIPIFSLWLVLYSNISVFERIRNTMYDASSFVRFNSWEKGFLLQNKQVSLGQDITYMVHLMVCFMESFLNHQGMQMIVL